MAARANYLAVDRPDVAYAVKEICRKMANPVSGDWQKLVRLGRYLKGAPRCVLVYNWQKENAGLSGCGDSDWTEGCDRPGGGIGDPNVVVWGLVGAQPLHDTVEELGKWD